MIVDPCMRICKYDPATELCRGCGRTRPEVARWGGMTDGERAGIMAGLAERMRLAGMEVRVVIPPR